MYCPICFPLEYFSHEIKFYVTKLQDYLCTKCNLKSQIVSAGYIHYNCDVCNKFEIIPLNQLNKYYEDNYIPRRILSCGHIKELEELSNL